MGTQIKFAILGLIVKILLLLWNTVNAVNEPSIALNAFNNRSFIVDWKNDRFLKDGMPFRFIAGSFHYFRAHPKTWQRKLRTMRAGGLNAVTTYVEWSLHNPYDGVYVWEGIANLEKFIRLAEVEDLLVILRPGPYICAERDLGGFPFWLLKKYPNINLRTSDANYLHEIHVWYSQLMRRMMPHLYGYGGPIIMVQVENEYGSYFACDKNYRKWLRDETLSYVGDAAVLFTNDGPGLLYCGHIDNVLATMDFGATKDLASYWRRLREIQPKGPLVNAEYYPGWLTHWSEKMARVTTASITKTFIDMLDAGASVNFYMYYGGTNFGFTAGANELGPGRYVADITSYDYDAPMDEAGDPTKKYFKIREIIERYLPIPNIPIPETVPKKKYGILTMQASCSLLSMGCRQRFSNGVVQSFKTKSFEELKQLSGLILYETNLPKFTRDPMILRVHGLRDRAYIYVDDNLIGLLSREIPIFELPVSASSGQHLQIMVENLGRINYGSLRDFKGIISDVQIDAKVLTNWTMTKYPFNNIDDINEIQQDDLIVPVANEDMADGLLRIGPTIFYTKLFINNSSNIGDTYLDTTGWGKGILFVNGQNLGRYWPVAGPQVTLYIPREVLKTGTNQIVMIEYQKVPTSLQITLTDKPNLDGLK